MALAALSIAQGVGCTVFVLTRKELVKEIQNFSPELNEKFIGMITKIE